MCLHTWSGTKDTFSVYQLDGSHMGQNDILVNDSPEKVCSYMILAFWLKKIEIVPEAILELPLWRKMPAFLQGPGGGNFF